MHPFPTLRRAALNLCLLCVGGVIAGAAMAAPYAISYTGLLGTTDFPEIRPGEQYTIQFIFDNGGTSAQAQTWNRTHLVCAVWRFNNASDVTFIQDLSPTGSPPTFQTGTVTTDSSGALTSMFTQVRTQSILNGGITPASAYSATGITLNPPVAWFANGGAGGVMFRDASHLAHDASNLAVQMDIAHWTAPVSSGNPCSALTAPPIATAVPALSHPGLALLGLAVLGGAWRQRRRDPRMRG